MSRFILFCDVCGKMFRSDNVRTKRCSPECNAAAKTRRNRAQSAAKHAKFIERKKRLMKDGVSASVREKVLEAKALGISYGKLQAMKAWEKAKGGGS